MADDLRRLAEAATAPGISEEARLEFTMQVFDAITPYTLLDLYAQLDAQAARIEEVEAALAGAEARNRRSFCVYCGQEQEHPVLKDRAERIIEHTLTCPERPEARMLDRIAALEAAGKVVVDTWGRVDDPHTRCTEDPCLFCLTVAALARALEGTA